MTASNTATAAGTAPPELSVDPFDLEILADPYPYYDRLRDIAPVVRNTVYDVYTVTRHAETQAVYADWQSFTSTHGVGMSDVTKPGAWRPAGPIVEADPPDHTKVRGVLNKILSPLVIRGWRESFEREGAALVDRLLQQDTFDGVRDVAETFVLNVFPRALGVEIDREQAIAVGDLNFNQLGPNNSLVQESLAKVAPHLDWWQRSMQRESMIPGGFGEQIFKAEEAGDLKPGTSSGLMMSFLRGGMDTTISGIGSTLWLLATHPDQWDLVHGDPSRVRAAFEETIRFESPIQTNFRTTTRPVELAGFRLEAGMKVQLLPGCANRDPLKWPDADRFDITRSAQGHVALGHGIHVCIGQMIARLEAESVLKPLAERVRKLELAGPVRHRPNNSLRTLESLPLRVTLA